MYITMARDRDIVRRDPSIRPTQETYEALQEAYDFFNQCLFEDMLPNCVITLKNRPRSLGFFAAGRYARLDGKESDEIALNPAHFRNGTLSKTLSTLVHEMVHLWQHRHGAPGRGTYHNRQWAEKMKQVGLFPSSTGKEGGKETGDSMSEYVIDGGPFSDAVAMLARRHYTIPWAEVPVVQTRKVGELSVPVPTAAPKSGRRVKYKCPVCALNAWAKPGARLACLEDNVAMQPAGSAT